MHGSRKICQRGPTLTLFFLLVDKGREDPSTTISGSSSAHQRNAIKWRFSGVPMIAQNEWRLGRCDSHGIRTCIARKRYIFVIFQGGGVVRIPCPHSRYTHGVVYI